MKRIFAIFCAFSIFCTGMIVIATEQDETPENSAQIIKYDDLDGLLRENSPNIKALISADTMSVYENVNPITSERTDGNPPETSSEKAERLEFLEKKILAEITNVKGSFIEGVNLELQIDSLEYDISSLDNALLVQKLLFDQGKLSEVEYNAFLNTYSIAKSNLEMLKTQLKMIKSNINVNIGNDVNAEIIFDSSIDFDKSVLDTRNFDADFDSALNNLEAYEDIKDYVSAMSKIYKNFTNPISKVNYDGAVTTKNQFEIMYEAGFSAAYNALDIANIGIENAKLELENTKNALDVAKTQFDLGLISKIDYEQAVVNNEKAKISVEIAENSFMDTVNSYNAMVNGEVNNENK